MTAKDVLRWNLQFTRQSTNMVLEGVSDADLLVRPTPGANHIAWQLGHLIASEYWLHNMIQPGAAPALPAGFAEKHDKATSGSDDPKAFLTKAEYMRLWDEQRAATLKTLEAFDEAKLDAPGPEHLKAYAPTLATLFYMIGNHETMHLGQYSVIRRKLGKPNVF